MPVVSRRLLLLALVCGCGLAAAVPAPAQTAGSGSSSLVRVDPNEDVRLLPSQADGRSIERVFIYLVNPSGDPARDSAARDLLARSFGVRAGGTFNEVIAGQALHEVRQLPEVDAAEYRLYRSEVSSSIVIALIVRTRAPEPKAPAAATGLFATKKWRQLPILFENDRSQLKMLLNPSIGAYTDRNPWLANPTAFNPNYDTPAALAWSEFGLEAGAGGIARAGARPLYFYGAATYIVSGTLNNDVFTGKLQRVHGEMEKLYGGLLVAERGGKAAFDLSAGRQRFNLNRHLLFGFVLGATNGGDRGASYLSPRQAQDLVINARLRVGRTSIQAFLADPNELPVADSRSRIVGLNLKYADNRRLEATLTLAAVPRSTTAYKVPDGGSLTRQGLRAIDPRVRWDSAFGVDGLWLEGELGHEWHADFPMSANGGGAWIGYRFKKAPWRPAVLYRYSFFSGDNPATAAYERFDPLLGGVQRDWLQGLVMVKMMSNANLIAQRIEVSVKPIRGMELAVDAYRFRAAQTNNLGGARPFQTFPSKDLGYEITPTLQWSVTRNLFIQALVSTMVPGNAMVQALPKPARAWTTAQLSLYAGF